MLNAEGSTLCFSFSSIQHFKERRAQLSTFNFQPSTFNYAPDNGRRLGLYDYLYGAGFLIPRIHTRLIAEHLKHAAEAGFTDYYAEVNPNWGLDGPMSWLVAPQWRYWAWSGIPSASRA